MDAVSTLPSPSIQLARSLANYSVDDLKDLSAFELFQKQLQLGSTEAAHDAMKRLTVVAIDMGVNDVKEKLVPFLEELVQASDESRDDELLFLLGQQLESVALLLDPKTAGPEIYKDLLIPTLERLASVEETVVREQAVKCLNLIVSNTQDLPRWISLAKRLASAEWFTPRVSVCGFLAGILEVSDKQQDLLDLYQELARDETPMVRRAAAQHLGKVLKAATSPPWDWAAILVNQLVHDEQDSVRLLALTCLKDVGDQYGTNTAWTAQHWLPLLKEGATDSSWRVRNNLAKNFSQVAYNLGLQNDPKRISEQSLVMACFVSLLTDAEAEVRASSVSHLARMVNWGGPQHFGNNIQPVLPALADDVVMEVRSKCALALMDSADGGTLDDAIILQAFGPLLEAFLQDEFHDVQLQVLNNLHRISHLLPGLAGVVSVLLNMSKANNWRVRQAIAKLLPHLAEARGIEFFSTVLLEPAWIPLLNDSVAMVRESIVQGMALLIQVAGPAWIMEYLLPRHKEIYDSNTNSYLMRMTILHGYIETAVASPDHEELWGEAISLILKCLTDKVANVRMVAARGLGRVVVDAPQDQVHARILPDLTSRLQEEEDLDVKHNCRAALNKIQG